MKPQMLPLPGDVRWRRLITVAAFLGLLYFFRKLAPVLVCFVILERSMAWIAGRLCERTRLRRKGASAASLVTVLAIVAGAVFLSVRRAMGGVRAVRHGGREMIEHALANPALAELRSLLGVEDADDVGERVKAHAMTAVHYATETAHIAVYLVIGLLLASIYLFEREEIEVWYADLDHSSLGGTIARWMAYLADAIAITVRMQVVVAAFNAVFTLPLLLFMQLPHIPALFVLILVSGLLPVVGNIIAGAVLCVVAYQRLGAWGVVIFLVVTFVLHKIESYFLNPRLAAKHVKLPGLLLVVSLLLFEQAFGLVGLFLSFPALYVAMRVRAEWVADEMGLASPAGLPSDLGLVAGHVVIAYRRAIRFEDVDAASIVFFARYLSFAHEAMEGFFAPLEGGYPGLIVGRRIGFPAVRVEADYRAPLRYGDAIRVETSVARIGSRSFAMRYRFVRERERDEIECAQIVHVVVTSNLDALGSCEMPGDVRAHLTAHLDAP